MANNPKVKGIKYGTYNSYRNQSSIDSDTLYWITDKGLLIRGDTIVVPTKVINVTPPDNGQNAYTFTIEAYATDPESPETFSFEVYTRSAVDTIIQGLTAAINTHMAKVATDVILGHVKLSDATDSDLNAATGGTAATPLAVKRALAAANQYTDEQIANISSGMTIIGTYGLQADNPDEHRSLNDIPASKGDTYICISTMTGVAYTNSAGIAVSNASLAPGDYIICVQAAVESGGTITTPARWTIVANTDSNAVTTNETLTANTVILGNGNKTVKKLDAGTNGQFLRQTPNGARWQNHVNLDHGIAYGVCDTAADEPRKTIAVPGFILQKYAIVAVCFNNPVPRESSLGVNDIAPMPIIYQNGLIPEGIISKGDTATFIYVPGFEFQEHEIEAWVLISIDRAPNNTPTNLSAFLNDIQGRGTCNSSPGTSTKTVSMGGVTIKAGSVFAVYFSYNVRPNAKMKINNSVQANPIYHRNAPIGDNQIRGGDTATFIFDGSYYHLLAVDRPILNQLSSDGNNHGLVDNAAIYAAIQSAMEEATLYWEEMQ